MNWRDLEYAIPGWNIYVAIRDQRAFERDLGEKLVAHDALMDCADQVRMWAEEQNRLAADAERRGAYRQAAAYRRLTDRVVAGCIEELLR